AEERGADEQADPQPQRDDLLLELGRGELELELDDRTGAVGDELRRAAEAGPVTSAGGHGLSSRSIWRAGSRRRTRPPRPATGSGRPRTVARRAAAPRAHYSARSASRPSAPRRGRASPSSPASA